MSNAPAAPAVPVAQREVGQPYDETNLGQYHWKKPDAIAVKHHPGFACRLVDKRNYAKRVSQGWVKATHCKLEQSETTSMDGGQHYRGLMLMEMPKQMRDERNAHYIGKHHRRLRAALVGSSMTSEGQKINQKTDGGLTGTIGKVVMQDVVHREDGSSSQITKEFNPKDVDPADVEELKEVKQKQRMSNKGR